MDTPWKRDKAGEIQQLIGHLRLPPAIAGKLLHVSGRRGVFLTQIKVTSREERVVWVGKAKKYFTSSDPHRDILLVHICPKD